VNKKNPKSLKDSLLMRSVWELLRVNKPDQRYIISEKARKRIQ
jgi:hypothetical protein